MSERITVLDFTYHTDSKQLFQGDVEVSLRLKTTQVLELLLTSPKQIISKEQLLSTIWSDSVVEEQVIFQSISELRQVFGSDSIKTHPKKGYSWQLDTTRSSVQKATFTNNLHWKKAFLLVALSLVILSGWFLKQLKPFEPSLNLLVAAIGSDNQPWKSDALAQILESEVSVWLGVPRNVNTIMATNSKTWTEQIESAKSKGFLDDQQSTLIVRLTRFTDHFNLRYLQANNGLLDEGSLTATTLAESAAKLSARLQRNQVLLMEFSGDQSTRIQNAKLQLYLEQDADNLLIIDLLAESYLQLSDWVQTRRHSEELLRKATIQDNPYYQQRARLLLTELNLNLHFFDAALDHFSQAEALSSFGNEVDLYDQPLDHITAKVSSTTLTHLESCSHSNDFIQLNALLLALSSNPFDQYRQQYMKLSRQDSREKMTENRILAELYFNRAKQSTHIHIRQADLETALDLSQKTDDLALLNQITVALAELYFNQNNTFELTQLVNELGPTQVSSASNYLLKGFLSILEKKYSVARHEFERSHAFAVQDGDMLQALNTSLRLLELSKLISLTTEEIQNHWQFIQVHAFPYWQKTNKTQISIIATELNLEQKI